VLFSALAPEAAAQSPGVALHELSPADEQVIERGLDALVDMQDRHTGAFGQQFRVASTSLAGLALLASGDQYMRGRHSRAIEGAVRFLLSKEVVKSPNPGEVILQDREGQGRMHSHGYAVLFLTQVYGQTERDREIAEVIRDSVRLIERAQPDSGGYGYYVRGESGFVQDEASVTITQIQALRAARDIGFRVDAGVIDRAVAYVKRSMGPDGSVCYSLSTAPNRRTFELTAAAVSTLNQAGVYYSEELTRGLGFMRERMRRFRTVDQAAETFYFYGNLYAAQAMYQAGGEDWETWFPSARQALIDRRKSDGSWSSDQYGDAYATACALVILQVPRRLLPVFQR